MDISGGTLILDGEISSLPGWVTYYNGSGTPDFDYDGGNDETTITATFTGGQAASNPNPSTGSPP